MEETPQGMKKIVFIDRDGVINRDPGGWTEHSYVEKWNDFHFLPGAKIAVKKLNDAGFDVIIVSNQAGVSRGFYTEEALNDITEKMVGEIEKAGGKIRKVYYCIHYNDDNCDCRKPKPGLFNRAERELGIVAGKSFFIGDGKMDVEAGSRKGLKTILVLSGKSRQKDVEGWSIKPDFIFADLREAAEFIISKGAR